MIPHPTLASLQLELSTEPTESEQLFEELFGLRLEPRLHLEPQLLEIVLRLENHGPESVDVCVSRGRWPGGSLEASLGDQVLQQVLSPEAQRPPISRLGPRPLWAPLPAGKALALGPWRYTRPPSPAAPWLRLRGELWIERDRLQLDRLLPLAGSG